MKSLQIQQSEPIENNPLKIVESNTSKPEVSQILIQIHTCAICRTDLHIIEGELSQKKSPLVPGHQIVGIVERVGEKVTKHKIGDRVGVPWLYSTCGVCDFCKKGSENLCNDAKFTGYDVDGGYAEYMVAKENFAYKIPERFSDVEAAPLLCAGIIGFRALRLSNIKPGERLGLYGFGASAHIAIQVAKHWGCEVSVFSRSEKHKMLAEELGATWVGSADEVPPFLLDSAISFAPAGELVPKALKVMCKGGTLALAGIYVSSIPQLDYNLLYHERTIRSVANSTRQDAIDFLKVAAGIPVKTEVEVFPLEEANRALQLLKASKINGAGVLVVK
ncbi:MAG: zinc-dependent alcohol dehydrogenase family protein [Bacteroidetes bacterium]|nr:zinc-dependent alcohol dehydrogenase family protein [Bacteroidota bacterium]